jgi:hypothetical protein
MEESYNPSDYPYFPKTLDKQFTQNKLEQLEYLFWKDAPNPMLAAKIGVDVKSLVEMVDMVERRRVYLHIFHRINMSEYNEISLYCFWILKFQPFYPAIGNKQASNKINANLAYRLFASCVRNTRKKNGHTAPIALDMNAITHAFCYQDISKEAIMLLIKSLIEA